MVNILNIISSNTMKYIIDYILKQVKIFKMKLLNIYDKY